MANGTGASPTATMIDFGRANEIKKIVSYGISSFAIPNLNCNGVNVKVQSSWKRADK